MAAPQDRTTGTLLGDAARQIGDLVRGEVELARAEVEQKLRRAVGGLVMIGAAAVLSIVALSLLCDALVAWLVSAGVAPGWAALIVAAGAAVLALILALVGRKAVAPSGLYPRRTAQNIRRDAEQIKESVSDDRAP